MPSTAFAPTNIILLTEQQSGMRLCMECKKLLPLDKFRQDKRKYTCIEHLRAEKRRQILGTLEKRAFNSIRCRARLDMLLFGHTKMALSRKQVSAMLTHEQMQNYSQFAVIPRRSDEMLTIENAVLVHDWQRRYVLDRYKKARDAPQYESDLAFISSLPNRNDSEDSLKKRANEHSTAILDHGGHTI